jgi:hypothetical protein
MLNSWPIANPAHEGDVLLALMISERCRAPNG